jgi:hypothetical protein
MHNAVRLFALSCAPAFGQSQMPTPSFEAADGAVLSSLASTTNA